MPTPVTAPPGKPPAVAPASARPGPQGPGDFAALLDHTTARTATAEGQQTRTAKRDRDAAPADADARPADEQAMPEAAAVPAPVTPPAVTTAPVVPVAQVVLQEPAGETPAGEAAAAPTLPTPVALTAALVPETLAPLGPTTPGAEGAGVVPPGEPASLPRSGVAGPAVPVDVAAGPEGAVTPSGEAADPAAQGATTPQDAAPEGAAAEGAATSGPGRQGAGQPGAGGQGAPHRGGAQQGATPHGVAPQAAGAAPGAVASQAAAAVAPQAAVAPPGVAMQGATPQPGAAAPPAAPGSDQAPPPPGATAAVSDAPADVAPPAPPTTATAATSAAPATPTATTGQAVPTPAQGLSSQSRAEAVLRIQDLVRISAARGHARAMMELHPAELGKVDIELRTSASGLVATIVAADQAALDALQASGDDLRRALGERGVQLDRLDLQLAAGGQGQEPRAGEDRTTGARRGATAVPGADALEIDPTTTTAAAPASPAPGRVDVRA